MVSKPRAAKRERTDMARGYSLHLGLNSVDPIHYGGWDGKLNACENDAKDMAAIAKALRYAQTILLLTRDATSTRFISEMLKLTKTLKAGDILFLSYSGHGGQIPDEASDEDDKYDETWCLYDRQVIDDEIFRLLGRFEAGVRIVVLSDSCHSGTVTKMRRDAGGPSTNELARNMSRAAGETILDDSESTDEPLGRAAPIEATMDAFNNHKDLYLALQAATAGAESIPPAAGVVLISGCMDDQLSLDGSKNGLFTANLKRVWNDGTFAGGYRLFHQTIVSRMPPSQTPNLFKVGNVTPDFMNQKPFVF
jgi:hypothetical protein